MRLIDPEIDPHGPAASRLPRPLVAGDRVALLCPSSAVEEGLAKRVQKYWTLAGYMPVLYPTATLRNYTFSGTDEQRLADLQSALQDDNVRAIHCLRGGYGLTRILDWLDLSPMEDQPKWVIGFSDITALHLALQYYGVASCHGPMGRQIGGEFINDPALPHHQALLDIMAGQYPPLQWHTPLPPEVEYGPVTAPLTGGNLTLLAHSIGSRYEVETEGRILFIEEVGEPLYSIDRLMVQLKRAGKLAGLAGLIVGDFSQVRTTEWDFGQSAYEIVLSHCRPYGYPIALGYPGGHDRHNMPLIMGAMAQLIQNDRHWHLAYQSVEHGVAATPLAS